MNEFVSAVSLIDWPAIPSAQGAAALALQYQLDQTQWWSAERLREAQLRQLTQVLRHAAEHVPLYKERFAEVGFDARADLTWGTFRRLPSLRRTDLQDRFDDLISKHAMPQHGRLFEGHSSGSTGRPIRFLKTAAVRQFEQVLAIRDHLWHGRDLLAKLAVIRTSVQAARLRGWGLDLEPVFWSGPCVTLNIATAIAEQARWLQKHRPRYLVTHASNARALALYCITHSISVPGLTAVHVLGEVVPPDLPDLVQRAWGAELTATYSCEESGAIALQCPAHRHYHVQSEHIVVEVVDDEGQPVAPGSSGHVLLTTLQNFAMPLIRYQIGDFATLGESCDCGRSLPVLNRVLGRARNLVTLPDGSRHWPSFPAEMWTEIAPVRQFRLVQKTLTRIEAQVVSTRPLSTIEQSALIRALQSKLGYPFDIALLQVQEIARAVNAKYEDFVSELSQP